MRNEHVISWTLCHIIKNNVLSEYHTKFLFVTIYIPFDADFQSKSNDSIFTGNGWKLTKIFYNYMIWLKLPHLEIMWHHCNVLHQQFKIWSTIKNGRKIGKKGKGIIIYNKYWRIFTLPIPLLTLHGGRGMMMVWKHKPLPLPLHTLHQYPQGLAYPCQSLITMNIAIWKSCCGKAILHLWLVLRRQ